MNVLEKIGGRPTADTEIFIMSSDLAGPGATNDAAPIIATPRTGAAHHCRSLFADFMFVSP